MAADLRGMALSAACLPEAQLPDLLAACEIRALTGRKADSDERNLAYNRRQLEWDAHLCRASVCGGSAWPPSPTSTPCCRG